MPAFVKTRRDEGLWEKAKRAATHAGLEPASERWYAFANKWFHARKAGKVLGGRKKRRVWRRRD